MSFSLTPQLELFVREHAFKLEQLRIAIAEGDKAIELSQSHVFNSEEELDQFFAKL